MGGGLLGWRTVCAVELGRYPRRVLLRRQQSGHLPRFPIWDDVRTFAGKPWNGRVDVVSGGFPCQDIAAPGKGAGLEGERSGLWFEMERIISEVRPAFVFVENSPNLATRGLGVILGQLATLGFNAEWGVLSAGQAGAPHLRKRLWICAAHPHREPLRYAQQWTARRWNDLRVRRLAEPRHDGEEGPVAHADRRGCSQLGESEPRGIEGPRGDLTNGRGVWWPGAGPWEAEPHVGRVVDGVAASVDRNARLRCTGNGQVPLCAAAAWLLLWERLQAGLTV